MSHLLPLSRVARLVGLTRSALQQMIRSNQLATFDGEVDMEELLRVFPSVRWEEDGEYQRVEEIKRKAFGKRIFERVLPDKEVLAERLYELGKEFAATKSLLLHYDQVFEWLENKMDEMAEDDPDSADALMSLKIWLNQHRDEIPEEAAHAQALLAEESIMRLMAANITLQPSGHAFEVEGNDTILEAALRAGIPLSYGCSNGNCGECRAHLVSGQVKKVHPHDYVFKEADKANGAILMCSYTPVTDVVLEAAIAGADDIPEQTITTKVKSVEYISDRILALHLTTPRSQRLRFLAGQSISLSVDAVEGEYYVANCPCEDRQLTIHVRRDNRPFARKAFDDLRKEDAVLIRGPHGSNVFKLESRRPALFVAWEDGFAPINSLIQHAMSLEVSESMHLHWAASDLGHYRDNLCRSWADALDNFTYNPIGTEAGEAETAARILAGFEDMTRIDIYAAGPATFLHALREGALARGMSPLGWHGELVV
jgi:CDP-4-dehydro-6-deoxyglucose reductase